jgi:hypothetical protein
MRIYFEDGPKGVRSYTIDLDGTENAEFRSILEGWLDALEFHEYKSRGYKNRDKFSLGYKGEFVGFWRKAQKLYAGLWESTTLTGEGMQEVLMDTFGSVGLMLQDLRKRSDKYSASWRDNHGNKPTFGPGPLEPRWHGVEAEKERITSGPVSEVHIFPAHMHNFQNGRCTVCTLPFEAMSE